jgi:hypothetical protein
LPAARPLAVEYQRLDLSGVRTATVMIKSELLREQGILIIAPDGRIEKADFKRLSNEIDPVIASQGKLAGVMIYAKSFPRWDSFGAFISHFKFVTDHHRQIDRNAAVTDRAADSQLNEEKVVIDHDVLKERLDALSRL